MSKRTVASLVLSAALSLAAGGCSQPVESLISSGDAAITQGDYRTATIQLKSALQRQPNNPQARWLLAEVYLAVEEGAAAEKEIRRASDAGIGSDAVLPALAQALLLQGKAEPVLNLDLPRDLSPRAQGELLAARGLAELLTGRREQANQLTEEALELLPGNKMALVARSKVLLDAGHLDEAGSLLLDLQRLNPDYGIAWSLLGDVREAQGDLSQAEQAYSTAMEKRARPHEDRLKRALVRFRQGDTEGALADAVQLNKALPKLQSAWYLTGAATLKKRDFDQAKYALDRAIELDPSHLPTIVLLAWSNFHLGNLNQALVGAESAMAIAPSLVASRMLMATLSLQWDEPQDAEALIRPVVAAQPENLAAKGILITSLQRQGKADQAVPLLEELAAASPDLLDVQAAVGLELVRAMQPGKALALLEPLAGQSPGDARVSGATVIALVQEQRFDEALAAARRFLEHNPNSVVAQRTLAAAHIAKGDLAAAETMLRDALSVSSADPVLSTMLADVLEQKGDLSGASQILVEAARFHPEHADVATSLGRIALLQERTAEAVSHLRRALQIDPASRTAQLLLAQQLLAQNDPAGAVKILPDDAGTSDVALLRLRGLSRLRTGDAVAALEDFRQLAALQPQSAQAHFQLAQTYATLGDVDRMDASLQVAARLDPGNVGIALARVRLLIWQGKVADAEVLAREVTLPESDPGLLATGILIADAKGDHSERLRLAQRLQTVAPSEEHLVLLAHAQYAIGNADKSVDLLENWFAKHPDADSVALQLADLYGRTGRLTDANVVLRGLADRFPNDPTILSNLARNYRETAPSESLIFAERAAALAPDDVAILTSYAIALAMNGRYQKALSVVEAAIQKQPESAFLRLQRVEVLEQSGDLAGAQRELLALQGLTIPASLQAWVSALQQRLGEP